MGTSFCDHFLFLLCRGDKWLIIFDKSIWESSVVKGA